jgi:hypothetical protein
MSQAFIRSITRIARRCLSIYRKDKNIFGNYPKNKGNERQTYFAGVKSFIEALIFSNAEQ